MNDIRQTFARHGLVRPQQDRVLGGVCAGLGRRFGLSPWLVRAIFLASLLLPGPQAVIYVVLWILMPSEDAVGVPVHRPAPTGGA